MKLDLTIDEKEYRLFRISYFDLRRRLRHEANTMAPALIECFLLLHYKFLVANAHRFKYMTGKQLAKLYHIYFNMPDFDFVEEITNYINPSVRNGLSAEGFIKLVEIWAFGTLEHKMKFCFAVYTYRDPRGVITKNRLKKLCRNMIFIDPIEDSYDLLNEYVDFVLRKMDVDRDGIISYCDYENIVRRNPRLLEFAGPIIPDMTRFYETIGDIKETILI